MVSLCVSHACGDLCLAPGRHLQDCVPVQGLFTEKVREGDWATWVPEDSVEVLLLKTAQTTLLYVHAIDSVFFAGPEFLLGATCPEDTTLRGRFLMEQEDGRQVPRILVWDSVRVAGQPSPDAPQLRYEKLVVDWFSGVHLIRQWCGDGRSLLDSIQTGAFRPPHRIARVIRVEGCPMRPTCIEL
jgi:hypothetical protein